MKTFALRVSESQRVRVPLKAAVVALDEAKIATFLKLRELLATAKFIHPGTHCIESDDPTPRFLYSVPEGFEFNDPNYNDLVSVPEGFTGYTTAIYMPTLRVYESGVSWHTRHVNLDEGVTVATAELPWELLNR